MDGDDHRPYKDVRLIPGKPPDDLFKRFTKKMKDSHILADHRVHLWHETTREKKARKERANAKKRAVYGPLPASPFRRNKGTWR